MRASRWQWVLLPFMLVSIVGAGALFVTSIHGQFSPVKECNGTPADLRPVFERARLDGTSPGALRFEVAALLEAKAMEMRHCYAGYMVRSRMWLRYMAFVTGVALGLVGATFIVGQLEIRRTEMGAESATIKGSLRTSSPGVVLAVLGAALMVAALAIKTEIEVVDTPAYWTRDLWSGSEMAQQGIATPRSWPEANK